MFKGILIEKNEQDYTATVKVLDDSVLIDGDTVVNVSHSTINYKDALAITGKSPVVRKFPMIPGIDLVGTVESCDSGKFKAGEQVLLNGFGDGLCSPVSSSTDNVSGDYTYHTTEHLSIIVIH